MKKTNLLIMLLLLLSGAYLSACETYEGSFSKAERKIQNSYRAELKRHGLDSLQVLGDSNTYQFKYRDVNNNLKPVKASITKLKRDGKSVWFEFDNGKEAYIGKIHRKSTTYAYIASIGEAKFWKKQAANFNTALYDATEPTYVYDASPNCDRRNTKSEPNKNAIMAFYEASLYIMNDTPIWFHYKERDAKVNRWSSYAGVKSLTYPTLQATASK